MEIVIDSAWRAFLINVDSSASPETTELTSGGLNEENELRVRVRAELNL